MDLFPNLVVSGPKPICTHTLLPLSQTEMTSESFFYLFFFSTEHSDLETLVFDILSLT